MNEEHASPSVERILIVCSGNICRSPYAAYMLQARLTQSGITRISVDSAGTRAETGRAMAPRISGALARRAIETSGFRSKPLTSHLVERADLILTAETAHRANVVRLEPAALGRVFTLRQFARLMPHSTKIDAASALGRGLGPLVQACSAARGMGQPARGAEDDVEDPWGRSRLAYHRSMKAIDATIDVIAAAVIAANRPRQ